MTAINRPMSDCQSSVPMATSRPPTIRTAINPNPDTDSSSRRATPELRTWRIVLRYSSLLMRRARSSSLGSLRLTLMTRIPVDVCRKLS